MKKKTLVSPVVKVYPLEAKDVIATSGAGQNTPTTGPTTTDLSSVKLQNLNTRTFDFGPAQASMW